MWGVVLGCAEIFLANYYLFSDNISKQTKHRYKQVKYTWKIVNILKSN